VNDGQCVIKKTGRKILFIFRTRKKENSESIFKDSLSNHSHVRLFLRKNFYESSGKVSVSYSFEFDSECRGRRCILFYRPKLRVIFKVFNSSGDSFLTQLKVCICGHVHIDKNVKLANI